MSSLKEFRSIADEIMNDMNVSEELKEKTLTRCVKRRHFPIREVLIPAACFVLILGTLNISGILPLRNQTVEPGNQEINLMLGTGDGIETLPGQTDNSTSPESGVGKSVLLETLEECEKYFGEAFLTPSYIPEGFKLDRMHASGVNGDIAAKVVISYVAGGQSFLIIEEKTDLLNEFNNFKSIDINGAAGYLKSDAAVENGDVELHWFVDGVHYSVAGLITDDEAVRIARSMR